MGFSLCWVLFFFDEKVCVGGWVGWLGWYFGFVPVIFLWVQVSNVRGTCRWQKKFLQGDKTRGQELWFKGSASIIHFVVDSISLRTDPNMIYCQICSFQPMEIYVDDEAKLTLHGLVQVGFFKLFAYFFF